MKWLRTLGVVCLFATLEIGALVGVPIPPEKVREILDTMNRPHAAVVKREESGDDVGEGEHDER